MSTTTLLGVSSSTAAATLVPQQQSTPRAIDASAGMFHAPAHCVDAFAAVVAAQASGAGRAFFAAHHAYLSASEAGIVLRLPGRVFERLRSEALGPGEDFGRGGAWLGGGEALLQERRCWEVGSDQRAVGVACEEKVDRLLFRGNARVGRGNGVGRDGRKIGV